MTRPARNLSPDVEFRLSLSIVIFIAVAILLFAWLNIRENRQDSLDLLVTQGKAFTEALAEAADNSIRAEANIDYLTHLRYSEVLRSLDDIATDSPTDEQLSSLTRHHDVIALYICDLQGNVIASGRHDRNKNGLPAYVVEEAIALAENQEDEYSLLLEPGEGLSFDRHYYLEIANSLDRIYILEANADYYTEALRNTQIGFLAQRMAREKGVEYIIYHTPDGIIFSSRNTGPLLTIDSDPFLSSALEADSISHRLYTFQSEEVLELVRPFSSETDPFGLFRVGLSLDRYRSLSRSATLQTAIMSFALFGLLLTGFLYLGGRRKRRLLSQEHKQFKSIADTMFDQMRTGVVAVASDGTIELVNKAFESIVGKHDLYNKHFDKVITSDELTFEKLKQWSRQSDEVELTIEVDKIERTLVLSVSSFEIGREMSGVIAVVYDITKLKEFERQSARKERLSEMGDLAAGVAHEIRNPLNTISIAAQRLAVEFAPDESGDEFKSFTDQIRSETRRLNDIITRFLSLAREQMNKKKEIHLEELLSDAGRLFELQADEARIDLQIQSQPDLILYADPDQLRQAILNLFNNAVEALAGQRGTIRMEARKEQSVLLLSVDDSGPGIKQDDRNEIFQPYFTTKEAGTGLGLPMVHRIVTDMGGEVRVEDSDLGGARVVLLFPVEG